MVCKLDERLKRIYLALGSNLGNRKKNIEQSTMELEAELGKVLQKSLLYQTTAWGNNELSPFLNRVISLETSLNPETALKKCLSIEKKLGRVRTKNTHGYQNRLIDIDLLFYESKVIQSPNLILPHPFIAERRFVLRPLCDIAADFIHPTLKKTSRELLDSCKDHGFVEAY